MTSPSTTILPDHNRPSSDLRHSTSHDILEKDIHVPAIKTSDAAMSEGTGGRQSMSTKESTILSGKRLFVVFVAMLLSLLSISLDQTILATALPRIASDFHAFSLQGWVATSSVLTQTIFVLFYGQVLCIFPAKWVLVSTIAFFETGSLICGVAHNVNQVIVGRTISGMGVAGMYIAMIHTITQVTRIEDRPRLYGVFGAVQAISFIIGPLVGGAFTDRVTWRWCFFINLPIGGVSVTTIIIFLESSSPLGSDPSKRGRRDLLRQTLRLDFAGATFVAGTVTSLVLALQWGGNTKSWNDKAVIVSFVFAAVMTFVFLAWEQYLGEKAMVPLKIFKSRSVYALMCYSFLSRVTLFLFSFYIPIFYQVAKRHTATASGVNLLPFILGTVFCSISSGIVVTMFRVYWPLLVAAPLFLAIGSGLLHTLDTTTSNAKIIGFQILVGIGVGLGMQIPFFAIQAEFRSEPGLMSRASSMGIFGQFLGGTVGLGIAEPIFSSKLSKYLLEYAPNAPTAIIEESPTAIYSSIPAGQIPGVVHAYTKSLTIVFLIGVPVAGLGLLASLFIKDTKF